MVTTNVHANVNIISQRSEHTWQEPLCVLPSKYNSKLTIKHTNKTFRHITTYGHTYTKTAGFLWVKLKSLLRTFYGRHHDLVDL